MTYQAKVKLVNNALVVNGTLLDYFRQLVEAAIAKEAIWAVEFGGTATIKLNAWKALANPAAEVNRFAWYSAFDPAVVGPIDANNLPTEANVQAVVTAKRDVAWGIAGG